VPEPPVTLVGLRIADRPGDGAAVKSIVPMKLLRDDMLMVPVPCAPGSRGPLMVGLAEMVKSGVGTGVTLMSRKVCGTMNRCYLSRQHDAYQQESPRLSKS